MGAEIYYTTLVGRTRRSVGDATKQEVLRSIGSITVRLGVKAGTTSHKVWRTGNKGQKTRRRRTGEGKEASNRILSAEAIGGKVTC